jgi:hypothetical protein
MPPSHAFCTIRMKPVRSPSGSPEFLRLVQEQRPDRLSTALWRPTSSAAVMKAPSAANNAARQSAGFVESD